MELNKKEVIKIAVTYEDGEIFQHFGQTRQFKIYEVTDGEIIRSEVVGTNGVTHCSLGSYLYEIGTSVLICGNLGMGASRALLSAGILVYAGNQGSADEAVKKLLRKELLYTPTANCGGHSGGCHHEEEDLRHGCSGHNHYEGGHNEKSEDNAGHNHRVGHDR